MAVRREAAPRFGAAHEGLVNRAANVLRAGLREVDVSLGSDWNRLAVAAPGGDVRQSREWAEHWSLWGWRPRFLRFADGYPMVSLERSWSPLPGGSAYLPAGPISAGEPAFQTAARLAAAYDYLVNQGVDVIATDAAIPASTGYRSLIQAQGFRPIEEIEPSRDRLSLSLAGDENRVFEGFSATTRQLIRTAGRRGLRVIGYGESEVDSSGILLGAPVATSDPGTYRGPMECFYDLLSESSARRRFTLSPRDRVVDWTTHALAARLAIYLEVRTPANGLLGGALFYRHGGRLTYAHAADRDDGRRQFPGASRLLLWRAIQLACREGIQEFDFGGVDIRGHREEPKTGDPVYGLYAFKKSFGGRRVELTGSHERVARPVRYLLGRIGRRIRTTRELATRSQRYGGRRPATAVGRADPDRQIAG